MSELSDEDLQRLYRYAKSPTRNGDDAYDLVHTAIVRWLIPGRPVVEQPRRYLMVAEAKHEVREETRSSGTRARTF